MNRPALIVHSVLVLIAALVLSACGGKHHVVVAPVTVEPIHVTIDVNLHDEARPGPPHARSK